MPTLTDKILNVLINIGIIAILLTPFPYATVETWSISLFEIISFCTFGLWCLREILTSRLQLVSSPLYLPFGLFFILIVLQLIPLPPSVLNLLSPKTMDLWHNAATALGQIFNENIINSYSISINPYVTKEKLLLYLSYATFFIVVSNYIVRTKQLRRYFSLIFIVAILQSLMGITQFLASGDQGPASGTYINQNHFAGFLILIIPLGLGYVFHVGSIRNKDSRRWDILLKHKFSNRLIMLFITGLMTLTLILSQSRSGIISAVASVFIFYVLASWNKQIKLRIWFIVALVAVIFFYSLWIGIDPVIDRFTLTGEDLPLRTSVWKDTITLIKDFPLLGTGLGTYSLAYTLYKQEAYWPTVFEHAHNDYLELLAEMGIIGFVLIMWGLILFYRKSILLIKSFHVKLDAYRYFILLGCISGTLGLLIHGFTDFNLQIPANAYYFTFLLGIATSIKQTIFNTEKHHNRQL